MGARVGALLLAQLLARVEIARPGELRRGPPAPPGAMGKEGAGGEREPLTFSPARRVAG